MHLVGEFERASSSQVRSVRASPGVTNHVPALKFCWEEFRSLTFWFRGRTGGKAVTCRASVGESRSRFGAQRASTDTLSVQTSTRGGEFGANVVGSCMWEVLS